VTNGVITKYVTIDGLGVIAKRVGLTTYWLHTDHLGSIQAITDSAGAIVYRRTYRPYGETISQTGSNTESRGWIDQRQDVETGLTYLHARYYDPTTGVFLSPDPAQADPNSYGYSSGNPVNASDPTGLDLVVCLPGLCQSMPTFPSGVDKKGDGPQPPGSIPGLPGLLLGMWDWLSGLFSSHPFDPRTLDPQQLAAYLKYQAAANHNSAADDYIRRGMQTGNYDPSNPSTPPAIPDVKVPGGSDGGDGNGGGPGPWTPIPLPIPLPIPQVPIPIPPPGTGLSTGVEVQVATVNPFTSSGGSIKGLNWQDVPGTLHKSYYYKGGGHGLNVGVSAQSVWAVGQGPWTGKFKAWGGSILVINASYFWSPDGGWRGVTYGFGLSPFRWPKGQADYDETDYTEF
jgi:RHS repeat-associated protein